MLPAAVPLPAWLRSEGEVSARVSAKRRLRVRLAHLSGGRRIGRPLVHPRPQHERVRLLASDERSDHGERHLGFPAEPQRRRRADGIRHARTRPGAGTRSMGDLREEHHLRALGLCHVRRTRPGGASGGHRSECPDRCRCRRRARAFHKPAGSRASHGLISHLEDCGPVPCAWAAASAPAGPGIW